jgi:hypothetical protein
MANGKTPAKAAQSKTNPAASRKGGYLNAQTAAARNAATQQGVQLTAAQTRQVAQQGTRAGWNSNQTSAAIGQRSKATPRPKPKATKAK